MPANPRARLACVLLVALWAGPRTTLAQPISPTVAGDQVGDLGANLVDRELLAKLEDVLSIPTCGVGILETRQSQLEELPGLAHADQVRYLEVIAHTSYGDGADTESAARAYLPRLAVRLLGKQASEPAQRALHGVLDDAAVHGAAELHLAAAMELAAIFHDPYGLDHLRHAIASGATQAAADAFSAALSLEGVDELLAAAVLRPDGYVLGRFFWDTRDLPQARKDQLGEALRAFDVADLPAGAAGMRSAALLLLGDAAQAQAVKTYLTTYELPLDGQRLYDLGQICDLLLQQGHIEGAYGIAWVVGLFAHLDDRSWYDYVVHVLVQHTPYTRAHTATKPGREAQAMTAWLDAHADGLSFVRDADGARGHWE